MAERRVIAVVGPTATGKSALADALAKQYDSCVISADSMQIYRGLDVGTAKTKPQQQSIPHYGIDIVDLSEAYSAAQFQEYARERIDHSHKQGRIPVLCGGTGLYVRAALDQMHFPAGGQLDNEVRQRWERFLREHGEAALFSELSVRDPKSAGILDVANHKRVIRALEMHESGDSYYEQAIRFKNRVALYPTCYIGLNVAREELYRRIDSRVDRMIENGLVEEASSLKEAGLASTYTAQHAIGYKELFRAFEGECSIEEAVEDIKRHSRQYAKRQLTWFRSDSRIQWIDATDKSREALMHEAVRIVDETFV